MKNRWEFTRNINGREVLVRKIKKDDPDKLKTCADCGSKTKFVVMELSLSVFSDKTKLTLEHPEKHYDAFAVVWGYCGLCEVG